MQSKHFEFSDYLSMLRQRKWLVIFCLIGVVIPVAMVTQFMTPVYEAEASIIYKKPKEPIFDLGQPRYDNSALVNITEVLKSRKLAEEVVNSLPAEVIQEFGFSEHPLHDLSLEKLIARQLQKNLRVIPVRSSDILRIKIRTSSPIAAKIIANTYVERIIDWNLRTKREEIISVRDFVEMQLAVFQDKLSAAEDTLRVFKEKNPMISLSDRHAEILKRTTEAEVRYNEAQAELAAQRQRQRDAERKIRKLAPSHILAPSPLEADLRAKQQGLKKIIADYNEELQSIPEKELVLARLIRNRDVNEKIYSILLEKREEIRIVEASKIGDIQVVDAAQEPIHPIKPKKKRYLAFAFVLGMAIGVGLTFFLESLDTSLKSQEEIEDYINLRVLTLIPTINPTNRISGFMKRHYNNNNASYAKLTDLRRSSSTYEAYRAFQVNFALINTDNILRNILITSAGPGEGKTLTTFNLAKLYAQSGMKTLLIDCDLRCGKIHKILNGNREPGLTNVLMNEIALHHAIQRLGNEKLDVLSTGTLPPNPSELLSTQGMRDVLAEGKDNYELVILDSPPLIAVTDSIVLSALVDGVCLVIRSGKTSREVIRKAKQLLESSPSRIVGVILNDIDLKRVYGDRYYKNYYYYYLGNNDQRGKDGPV
ncbi:MAG: polysaccharide biosynthesis tyrosine autokinase [Aliifodinibius sp.]|nr:polysaccharide biosynthesis tyrosine autokinase [Fodinibius sp.]